MTAITLPRATVEQALEALDAIAWSRNTTWQSRRAKIEVDALRAALAQEQAEPAQEPVPQPGVWMHPWPPVRVQQAEPAQQQAEPLAWLQPKTVDAHSRPDLGYEACSKDDYGAFPVYTAPPRRRLTDDEIGRLWFQAKIPGLTETSARLLIRAAEEALRSKGAPA